MPQSPPREYRFKPDNARAYQAKAVEARHKNKVAKQLRQLAEQARLTQEAQDPLSSDLYLYKRLARVRAQLDKIDDLLLKEADYVKVDAQKLDRLASAMSKLSEVELFEGRGQLF